MIHGIPTSRASVLMRIRRWLTTSICRRSLNGLALICVLFAAVEGVLSSALANDQKSPPKAVSATTPAAGARTGAALAGVVAANPEWLQRRRQAIAQMLEGNINYRTVFDVKLLNAKLAGPFSHEIKGFFSSETHRETLYCVEAEIEVVGIRSPSRLALIRVWQTGQGSERLEAAISKYSHSQCRNAKYGPFPELEQARARRRKALGKAD